MSEKKKPAKDKHKSGFLVRLPTQFRAALLELKRQNRRPITQEVQMALETHLAASGIKVTPA